MERLMTEHGNRKSLKYNSRRHVQNSYLTSRISRKHSVDNGERNIGSHHQVSTNKIKHPLNDFLRVNRVNSYMSRLNHTSRKRTQATKVRNLSLMQS